MKTNSTTTDPEVESVVERSTHSTLDTEIAEWREWWGQRCEMGQPCFGEMATRLQQFREHLHQHFTEEEQSGCLSIGSGLSTKQAVEIKQLQDEHREFVAELDRLIERLQSGQPQIECWGQARHEFEDFLDRLNLHEDAEEKLSR